MDWHCQIIEPGRFYVEWKGKTASEIKDELEQVDKKIKRRFRCREVLWLVCGNKDQIQFPQIQFSIMETKKGLALSFWDRDGDFLFSHRRVSKKLISNLQESLSKIPKHKKRCTGCGRWCPPSLIHKPNKWDVLCRRCRKGK